MWGGLKSSGGRKIGERCIYSCKRECMEIDEERQQIHENFWALGDINLQRGFLIQHVKEVEKQRERKRESKGKGKENKSKRENEIKPRNRQKARVYSFSNKNGPKVVCQKFFLSTLDIDEKRVRTALKSITISGTIVCDGRGYHHKHYNVADREQSVIEHIKKFKTVESHYVRKTSKGKYLPQELNIKSMHRMYVEDGKDQERVETYDFYVRVFTEKFNLKFQKPKKDQCDKCEGFKNTPEELKTPEMVEDHDKHIDEKENAREFKATMKKEGTNDNVLTSAFDLEKVLLCPHGPTSSFYYCKRLKLHNFTLTDIQSMETQCFIWHEGEAQKGASEIGTCLQKYIEHNKENVIHLFSDRSGGQNSNRMVIIALHEIFLQLGMNFLVSGHSQNENDTAHSSIENITRMRKLYTPEQWKAVIPLAFKPDKVIVHSLKTKEIIDFKDVKSFPEYKAILNDEAAEDDTATRNKKDSKVYWSKIMQYKFVKNDPKKMYFNYHYSSPSYKFTTIYKKIHTRSADSGTNARPLLYTSPVGIDPSKKASLLKLCKGKDKLIPEEHHEFFERLRVWNDNQTDSGEGCSDENESEVVQAK